MLKAALRYAENGLPVVPFWWLKSDGTCACGKEKCKRGKHPIIREWQKNASADTAQVTEWWTKYPYANIGVLCGERSGWLVLDVDAGHGGYETLAELEQRYGALPDTVTQISGGGGRHYVFRYEKSLDAGNKVEIAKGLDIRSAGGLIVAAPSTHESGNKYRWADGHSPADIRLAEFPEWLYNLCKKPAQTKVAGTAEGNRNNTLTKLAGSMRAKGASEAAIYAALLEENKAFCPPLDNSEVRTIAASIAKYEPKQRAHRLTDMGNAERLCDTYGQEIKYCFAAKRWYRYDGRVWVKDEHGIVRQRAMATIRNIYIEAANTEDDGFRKALIDHARKSESNSRLKAMVEIAADMDGMTVDPADFDRDKWLLNCKNGVIDLRNGKLLPHDKVFYFSHLCPVSYDAQAERSEWHKFLDGVTGGDTELIAYLQKAAGYCLTGDTSEQALFILYGSGSNGKSTFTETLAGVLGEDYAKSTTAKTFMQDKRGDAASNDIARLNGARLVTTMETEDGQRLSTSIIKSATGGDKMAARFLYGEYFEFMPEFKLFFAVNHRPVIRDDSHSIWRRVKLVPFTVTFTDAQKDKRLKETLAAEYAGILAWAVEGCLLW
jgi:putative DNA primase/helicase